MSISSTPDPAAAESATQQVTRFCIRYRHRLIPLARFGYAAKGAVYSTSGLLLVQAALVPSAKITDAQGALEAILRQPLGGFLLPVLALGLVGHVLWRLLQAVLDTEDQGTGVKGIGKRFGYALSGAAYASLSYTAFVLALSGATHVADRQGMSAARIWTARFLGLPILGPWLVGLVGLGIIALGVNALYVAYGMQFKRKLATEEMEANRQGWLLQFGRAGLAARGVVFGVVGWLLVQAAAHLNAARVRDLDGTLRVLARLPFGSGLLGVLGVGFLAYGVFMFVQARYRHICIE